MGKILTKVSEFLDGLLDRLMPAESMPSVPEGKLCCNVSAETIEWNKAALEYARKPGNCPEYAWNVGLVPKRYCNVSAETNEWNRAALGYVQDKKE
jgi:hypothetical protein